MMADDELFFRGLNPQECSDFIRKLHKLAYEEGRLRDSGWIADRAVICFTDDALRWYDQQSLDTQADWTLLRRALLTHYSSSSNPAAPPEPVPAGPIPRLDPIHFSATQEASAAIDSTSPTILYRVKVVAPGYIGYVSKIYAAGTEGRCCILSSDQDDAMTVNETDGTTAHGSYGLSLEVQGSGTDGHHQYLSLASLQRNMQDTAKTWRGWLVAARRFPPGPYAGQYTTNDDSPANFGLFPTAWMTNKDGALHAIRLCNIAWFGDVRYNARAIPGAGDSAETWKTFSDKFIPVIGNTPSGKKTLHFWSRRVWEDKDEQFVAISGLQFLMCLVLMPELRICT